MTRQTTGTTARKIAPVYLLWEGDLILDSPIKDAWPHVINYPSWQNYSSVEHISGEPGQEGEVVLLKKDEEGFTFPPYCTRTIKLDPACRVIWKTYPAEPTEENDFFGIVDFSLHEMNGKTRFSYKTLYEFLVPYRNENDLHTFREQQYDNFEALFSSILPKLQEQVKNAT